MNILSKKKKRCLIGLAVFMLLPIWFGYINSVWFIMATTKENFSDAQIKEICEQLQIKLALGETIRTSYFAGVLQATTFLTVYVQNIASKEDFLSRHLFVISDDFNYDHIGEYYMELFQLGRRPKDYSCSLTFIYEDGSITAVFHIVGFIPNLGPIYNFLWDPWQPLFSNPLFITPLLFEIGLIVYLIAHKFYSIKQGENLKNTTE